MAQVVLSLLSLVLSPALVSMCDWKVTGTKNGSLPISLEKRPCGKKVTLIANVANPGALISELKGRLGTGGTVGDNGVAEIQGDHVGNVTKYLLGKEDHLVQVAGCGKKVKEREEKKKAKEEEEAREAARLANAPMEAAARREEDGKKARWSTAKKDAVARTNSRPDEPKGWSDDPRRCPFGWLYCSGACMGLTPAEFKATKQHVWLEETDFYNARSAFGKSLAGEDLGIDIAASMSLDGALRALGMLAMGVGDGKGTKKKEKKKATVVATATRPAAAAVFLCTHTHTNAHTHTHARGRVRPNAPTY